jgi:hypothetical protein
MPTSNGEKECKSFALASLAKARFRTPSADEESFVSNATVFFLLCQVKTDFSSRLETEENEGNEGESFVIFVFFCEK